MSEQQSSEEATKHIQEADIISDAPREVVAQHRTNGTGVMLSFIAVALFVGLLFGYLGGRVSAEKDYAAPSSLQGMPRGYSSDSFEQALPWGGYGRGVDDPGRSDSSSNAI